MILFASSDSTGRSCFSPRQLFLSLIGGSAAALVATPVLAQTRYVTDELVITFRTGPSTSNSVTRNLRSGARVELVDDLEQNGYVLVRLPDGEEGWVLLQYLQDEPTADELLDSVAQELAVERARADELERQLQDAQGALATSTQSLGESTASVERLNAELSDIRSASADALATRAQNQELADRVGVLGAQVDVAQSEIERLSSRERQNWFLTGSAVLAAGIVIGLIAPLLRRRRRSSW